MFCGNLIFMVILNYSHAFLGKREHFVALGSAELTSVSNSHWYVEASSSAGRACNSISFDAVRGVH